MKHFVLIVFIFLFTRGVSQDSLLLRPGSRAPNFILNLQENTIQSFTMPYMRRIVLLHFWSSNVKKSRTLNKYLNRLAQRYKNAQYRNADGFEIIAVAVQTDRNAWKDAIANDTLTNFTHGIAIRGYNDDICKKYGVTSLPTDILIDDYGMILAVNPKMMEIETILDDRKNIQPVKKDVTGTLAQSSSKEDVIKFIRLYLFNFYGDSLAKTITTSKGEFIFSDVKINQDFVLKVDNKIDINTSDPIALYAPNGEFMMDGRTKDKGFSFYISARNSNKLVEGDSLNPTTNLLGQIDVIKHLTFYADGMGLTPKDEQELNPIISMLMRDKNNFVEVTTHTDARMDATYAMELTTNQANAVKNYFLKKGVAPGRIRAIAKGNSDLRKICEGTIDCREEDHKLNRRVEFLIFKN
jgi:outer membrane protein OmpA-like peptidoglycan-associated protein/thiol-disulfide isomerase/thioredoxin